MKVLPEVKTYLIKVKCDNCYFSDVVAIPKGKRVSDAKCPVCGCTELFVPYGSTGQSEERQPNDYFISPLFCINGTDDINL